MDELEQNAELVERLVKREILTREEIDLAQGKAQKSGGSWVRDMLQGGKLSFGAIEEVLRYEFHPKAKHDQHMNLGRTLVAQKAITESQLKKALAAQKRNGRLLGNILLDEGLVTRDMIGQALAKQAGMDFQPLAKAKSERAALDRVPKSLAIRYEMIPFRMEGDKLVVLIAHPQGRDSLKDCGLLLGLRISAVLTASDDLKVEIKKRYAYEDTEARTSSNAHTVHLTGKADPTPTHDTSEDTETMATPGGASATGEREAGRFDAIAAEASGASVIKLVNTILQGAVNSGATDVHLDPQEPEMRIRYRIDGVLHDVMSIPEETVQAVVSRVKILSDMDITETRRPQDGHFSLDLEDREFDVRVATMPCFLGERVVLRLLDQSSVLQGIRELGLDDKDQKKLAEVINQPYGMILVCGPTGSGKTTTLYACLNQKNVLTDSIVTLEDPVEYQLSGINQVQIETDIDLSFANTLRAALRQDIDVLLVGEIRDQETARIAVRAAMTGHLVFSTLHTNDAPEAISTLRNMGVESYLIASALTAVVGQRLVRKICDDCKAPFKPSATLLKSIGLPATTKQLWRGKGCEMCYHTGNRGRLGIFELLPMTEPVRKLVLDDAPIAQIAKVAKLRTMAEDCRQKLKNGLVNPEEFLRVIRT